MKKSPQGKTSLRDEVLAEMRRAGTPCSVAQLEPELRTAVDEMLERGGVHVEALARVLQKKGHKINGGMLRNHRTNHLLAGKSCR